MAGFDDPMRRLEKLLQQRAARIKRNADSANRKLRGLNCPACGAEKPFRVSLRKRLNESYDAHLTGCCSKGVEHARAQVRHLMLK